MFSILFKAAFFRSILLFGAAAFSSCIMFFVKPPLPDLVMDLVCRQKAARAAAYKVKYMGKVYYFDRYACRTAFKMNPEKLSTTKVIETMKNFWE